MSLVHQNWWFTTLLIKQFKYCPPLSKSLRCDVLIVGGGVRGINAAAEFVKQGKSVVLIERNIVGGGSAGRSAGFPPQTASWNCISWSAATDPKPRGKSGTRPYAESSASLTASKILIFNADLPSRTRFFSVWVRAARKPLKRKWNAERASASPTSKPMTSRV